MFKSIQSRESFMQNETITSAYVCRKEEDMYVGKKQLAVEPPYHFDQVLRRLSSDPLKAVDLSQREIKVPIRLEQKPYVVIVQATGTKDAPMFRVRSNGPEEPLLSEVKRIFGMEHQLHMIQDHFSQTNLGSIFEQHIGTPLMLDFSFISLFNEMHHHHQQLNLSFAYELTKRFVSHVRRANRRCMV
ncbi:hypothetical protein BsIDN1_15030 [Bacillus safensis]|uniref:Uncharacterized protein n=1 Tax=Bacillus safensis TaxID=561879 RepID=A0A5S9M508_BACIA|nr:hypothetical protein BsIDN1_15030 [Bacillus safensis]